MTRRPLPALISLVGLLLLTALVWWRVIHRNEAEGTTSTCTTPSPTPTVTNTLPAPGQVTVSVLNATNRTGIAGRARTALLADGFKIPSEAGNDRPKVKIPGVAEIRYGTPGAKGARLLSYYFPGARLVPNAGKSATVVVSLGEKYKAVASSAAVRAALQAEHLTISTPAPQPEVTPTC
jgi:hypothetical protein